MTVIARCFLLAAAVVAGGCSQPFLTQPEAPAALLLDASPRIPPARRSTGLTLLVAPPQAQAGFDTRRVAYTRSPLTLEYYTRSEWADTPARMLGPLVVRALESSGAFRAVVAGPAPVPVDLRLDLELVRLQQEFVAGGSRTQVELRAKLFDVQAGRVLATRLFSEAAPAPTADAYGGARAASVATAAALEALTAFVVETLSRR